MASAVPNAFDTLTASELESFLSSQNVPATGGRDELLATATGLPPARNLKQVRKDIASIMRDPDHDDGSYAPLLIRFAWHNCGTFCKKSKTGGSNGSTMRFPGEAGDGENSGLGKARQILQPVADKHKWLSQADLWVLAGYVAIEHTAGPHIPFATGRADLTDGQAAAKYGARRCPFGDGKHNPSGSRLPAADLGPNPKSKPGAPGHVREKPTIDAIRGTFTRMGFSDKETVCLIVLGHQYGRCHPDVSGYEHPWYVFDPAHWNVYEHGLGYLSVYQLAVSKDRYREVTNAQGKRQYNMNFGFGGGEPFMMLPVDMALWWDPKYRKHIQFYDSHRAEFRRDAAAVWKKLTELGCDGLLTPEATAP